MRLLGSALLLFAVLARPAAADEWLKLICPMGAQTPGSVPADVHRFTINLSAHIVWETDSSDLPIGDRTSFHADGSRIDWRDPARENADSWVFDRDSLEMQFHSASGKSWAAPCRPA